MKLQDLYKYSWFADLSYVRWSEFDRVAKAPANASPDALIAAANDKDNPRIPGQSDGPGDSSVETLGERIFYPTTRGGLGWRLLSFTPNDETGFAASNIFSRVAASLAAR